MTAKLKTMGELFMGRRPERPNPIVSHLRTSVTKPTPGRARKPRAHHQNQRQRFTYARARAETASSSHAFGERCVKGIDLPPMGNGSEREVTGKKRVRSSHPTSVTDCNDIERPSANLSLLLIGDLNNWSLASDSCTAPN